MGNNIETEIAVLKEKQDGLDKVISLRFRHFITVIILITTVVITGAVVLFGISKNNVKKQLEATIKDQVNQELTETIKKISIQKVTQEINESRQAIQGFESKIKDTVTLSEERITELNNLIREYQTEIASLNSEKEKNQMVLAKIKKEQAERLTTLFKKYDDKISKIEKKTSSYFKDRSYSPDILRYSRLIPLKTLGPDSPTNMVMINGQVCALRGGYSGFLVSMTLNVEGLVGEGFLSLNHRKNPKEKTIDLMPNTILFASEITNPKISRKASYGDSSSYTHEKTLRYRWERYIPNQDEWKNAEYYMTIDLAQRGGLGRRLSFDKCYLTEFQILGFK